MTALQNVFREQYIFRLFLRIYMQHNTVVYSSEPSNQGYNAACSDCITCKLYFYFPGNERKTSEECKSSSVSPSRSYPVTLNYAQFYPGQKQHQGLVHTITKMDSNNSSGSTS